MSESVTATTDFEKLYVTCDTIANRDLVALVPGAKWRDGHSHWELNLTWASCKQLRSIFGEDLFLDDTVIDWGTEELNNRIVPCMELRNCLNPSDLGIDASNFDPRLYGYQAVGAQFLASACHGILSDPPGAGKTATAITAARLLNVLPALVVAPKSTLISWSREVEQWWPGTPVYVVTGKKEQRQEIILEAIDKPGLVIINWESVWRHSRLTAYGSIELQHCSNCDRGSQRRPDTCHRCEKELNEVPFRLIIADEAHRMQKPKSIQTRALWHLGDSPSVQYRWALTGTPLTNQIDSLWSILRYINKEEWPSKVAFIDRYALTRIVPWGSGSEVIGLNPYNEEEFQEIFQPRFRRMPKEIILPQLPPITRTRRYLQMSETQRRCYEEMAEDMVAETESGELLIAANPAVKMLRMVQFSSAVVDMILRNQLAEVPEGDEDLGERVARLVDPSNKLDALMDDLPDLIEAGEQIAVFAVSRQLIEMAETRLKKAKIKFSVIKGNQKQNFRQEQIDSFQNGKVPVILVVIAAGGVGVNLTAGRIGIFLQRSWSFIDNHQAEGRLHRIGSEIHEAIEYIDYISEGTVDEVVVEVAEGKELRLEEIVRDRETVRRLLSGRIDD
jgi:SNF2 family DNA or RNA helicase